MVAPPRDAPPPARSCAHGEQVLLARRGLHDEAVDGILDQLVGTGAARLNLEDNHISEEGTRRLVERLLPEMPMSVDACLQTARDEARAVADHFRGAQIAALMDSLDVFEKVLACGTPAEVQRVLADAACGGAGGAGMSIYAADVRGVLRDDREEFMAAVLHADTPRRAEELYATLRGHAEDERRRVLARAFTTAHPFTETLKARALRDTLQRGHSFEYILYCLAFHHETQTIADDVRRGMLADIAAAQGDGAWGSRVEDAVRVNFVERLVGAVREGVGAGDGAHAPRGAARPPALETLRLGGNPLGDLGALQVSRLLHYDTALVKLYLNACCLGDEGAEHIAAALRTCNRTLTLLDVTRNAITDIGGVALAEVFETNRTLTTMRVDGNDISDEIRLVIVRAAAANAGGDEGAAASDPTVGAARQAHFARLAHTMRDALRVPCTPAAGARYQAAIALTPHDMLPGAGHGHAGAGTHRRKAAAPPGGAGVANAAHIEEMLFRIRTLLLLGKTDRALNVVEDFLHDPLHCPGGAERCRNRKSGIPSKALGKTVLAHATSDAARRRRRRPRNMSPLFDESEVDGGGDGDASVQVHSIESITPPGSSRDREVQRARAVKAPARPRGGVHEEICDGPRLHGVHVVSLPAAEGGCGDPASAVVEAGCAVYDDAAPGSVASDSDTSTASSCGRHWTTLRPCGVEGGGVLPSTAPYAPVRAAPDPDFRPPERPPPGPAAEDDASRAHTPTHQCGAAPFTCYYAAADTDYEHFVNAWSEETAAMRRAAEAAGAREVPGHGGARGGDGEGCRRKRRQRQRDETGLADRGRGSGRRYTLYHKAERAWRAADWRARETYVEPQRATQRGAASPGRVAAGAAARAPASRSPSPERVSRPRVAKHTRPPARPTPRERLYSFDVGPAGRGGCGADQPYYPSPDSDYQFFINAWSRAKGEARTARRYLLFYEADRAWRQGGAQVRRKYTALGRQDMTRGGRSMHAAPVPVQRQRAGGGGGHAKTPGLPQQCGHPQLHGTGGDGQGSTDAALVVADGRVQWRVGGQRFCVRHEPCGDASARRGVRDVWVEVDGVRVGDVARGIPWPPPPGDGTCLRGSAACVVGVAVQLPLDVRARQLVVRALFPVDADYLAVRGGGADTPPPMPAEGLVGEGDATDANTTEAASSSSHAASTPPVRPTPPPPTREVSAARHGFPSSATPCPPSGDRALETFQMRATRLGAGDSPCVVVITPDVCAMYTSDGDVLQRVALRHLTGVCVGQDDAGRMHVELASAAVHDAASTAVFGFAGEQEAALRAVRLLRAVALKHGVALTVGSVAGS